MIMSMRNQYIVVISIVLGHVGFSPYHSIAITKAYTLDQQHQLPLLAQQPYYYSVTQQQTRRRRRRFCFTNSCNINHYHSHARSSHSSLRVTKYNNHNNEINSEIVSSPVDSVKGDSLETLNNSTTVTVRLQNVIVSDPKRSILFSLYMILSGALLGPFLDTYHSLSGVLQYNHPTTATLWNQYIYSNTNNIINSESVPGVSPPPPALVTAIWVALLFGIAGFLIGWLYILLDALYYYNDNDKIQKDTELPQKQTPNNKIFLSPSPPKILFGISYFTFQYWLSGVLVNTFGMDRTTILLIMSITAMTGFVVLDPTISGFITSCIVALGGPLIEIGLLTLSQQPTFFFSEMGYHYSDLGETGYFPLWIVPIYFLGGPANGNLARGYWNMLSSTTSNVTTSMNEISGAATVHQQPRTCSNCKDTRCTPCPNCDGLGSYTAMTETVVKCNACKGRGYVICRNCFDQYNEDPYDIDSIRELMTHIQAKYTSKAMIEFFRRSV